ncbi:MAG TPA: alpha-amylase family protein [Dysgonamonadaceae bacterium]|nr:alpha-amylase family protein [Dysgonamonadaceae bacterium]
MSQNKIIIYQVLPRLFGNKTTRNKFNGTIDENGSGKFAHFTNRALSEIKKMGFTHIWYTGILAHASKTDYTANGIPKQYPEIIKGNAGSPYAIRDYYDVDPDLAEDVDKRMHEFEQMVTLTHKNEMGVIIDFVPNHLARDYKSIMNPEESEEFGANDDPTHSFLPSNNFYYIPDNALDLSLIPADSEVVNYIENPAKVTGNDSFTHKPSKYDWYETVKLNYGIDYQNWHQTHFSPIPDTWHKMKKILMFWAEKKVDAFRCDMAEMVPLEFWEWVIPRVKEKFPHILFIAEIYNKDSYRNFLSANAFDYLYDKVGLYDVVRDVACGYRPSSDIAFTLDEVGDIQQHMLNFIENHDEQRVASDFFLGNAKKGIAAMILTACIGVNPIMIYSGQELGEKGMDKEGFSGKDGRTTIFDYWSIDKLVRWNNQGKWNKSLLTSDEKELRDFYTKLLQFCGQEKAISKGAVYDLMHANYENDKFNSTKKYAFLRGYEEDLFLIIVNFNDKDSQVTVNIPEDAYSFFQKEKIKSIKATPTLTSDKYVLTFEDASSLKLNINAHSGEIFKITFK